MEDDLEVVKSSSLAIDRRTCPMCGEKSSTEAKRCRSCGELLTGEDRPAREIYRSEKLLVMEKTAVLPDYCVKTNQPAEKRILRTYVWYHPLFHLLLFLGPLIYIIVVLIVRKTVKVEIPISQEEANRRNFGLAIAWLLGLSGPAILLIAGILAKTQNNVEYFPIGIAAGMIVSVVGLAIGQSKATIVTIAKITNDYIYFKGVNPNFLDRFPEFDGE